MDVQAAISFPETEFFYQKVLDTGLMRDASGTVVHETIASIGEIMFVHPLEKDVTGVILEGARVEFDLGIVARMTEGAVPAVCYDIAGIAVGNFP